VTHENEARIHSTLSRPTLTLGENGPSFNPSNCCAPSNCPSLRHHGLRFALQLPTTLAQSEWAHAKQKGQFGGKRRGLLALVSFTQLQGDPELTNSSLRASTNLSFCELVPSVTEEPQSGVA
jgi:hypothetical protein